MPEVNETTVKKEPKSRDSSELVEKNNTGRKPNSTKKMLPKLDTMKDLAQSIVITQGNEISNFFGPDDFNLLENSNENLNLLDDEPVEIKEGLKLLIKNFENPGETLKKIKIEEFEKCSDTILEEFTKIHFVFLKLERQNEQVLKNINKIIFQDESLIFQQQYLEILLSQPLAIDEFFFDKSFYSR